MKRVFKTRHFQRWMRKTELTDAALCKAVEEMASGLIDADLGGGVVKKRVGLAGRGKRSGARTLVATNKDNRQSAPTSVTRNWRVCGPSPPTYWPAVASNWMKPLPAALCKRSANDHQDQS
jgi:hypothetical protein